ncbi:MAG: GHKL domain-containing protein [Peptococcaceae bacterium]|nr:GHKL domain-containing protein [Peptococcaceae bacterium]
MDQYMSILFMLTISFPEAVLLSYLALQIMGTKPRIAEVLLIGIMQAIVAYIVRSQIPLVGLHTILQLVSLIFLISYISRINLIISAIGIIISVAFYLIQEMMVSQVMLSVSGMSVADVINHEYMRIVFFAPNILVMVIAIWLSRKYRITFQRMTRWKVFSEDSLGEENRTSSNKEYLLILVYIFLPIFTLFTMNQFYMSAWLNSTGQESLRVIKFLVNGLTVFLAVLSVWALRRTSISIRREFEAKNALETISQLKELIMSIRKQRHDFNNHLQVVYSLIENGSCEKAREYIQKTYNYASGTGELIKTDNPSVSALLYSKIIIAETNNIELDIFIDCSLEDFPLNNNESTSLFGNLVDNAFDAVQDSSSESKKVKLDVYSERGVYYIDIANSAGEMALECVERFFEGSFTTKTGHSGLGLTIVKGLVDKYHGEIEISCKEKSIVFNIKIPHRR